MKTSATLTERIKRLKRNVGIEELIEHLGGKVQARSHGQWVPCTCPFHDDTNASASINTAKGRFRCHGCDVGGDLIDLAQKHLETEDLKEAVEWLERNLD